ncbi:MAG: ribonuclease H-like domain-containing protein [Acidobacteriia bacterium]|nr:ribonuclease H-like domain-containing protein [Terriglobia bacterium]
MRVAYLDIETNYVGSYTSDDQRFFRDSVNHQITVLGVRVMDGDSDELVQLFDKEVNRARLVEALAGTKKIVTYNGRSIPDAIKNRVGFDFPVIAAQLGIVLDKEFSHLDLCPECWKKNLYGGQKKVEQKLGLRREFPEREGAWAMEAYRAYMKTGEERLRSELLAYNKEDIFMLRELEIKLAALDSKPQKYGP